MDNAATNSASRTPEFLEGVVAPKGVLREGMVTVLYNGLRIFIVF